MKNTWINISPSKISFCNLVEIFNDKSYSKFNISFNLGLKITKSASRNPLIQGFSIIRIACLSFPNSFDFDFVETFWPNGSIFNNSYTSLRAFNGTKSVARGIQVWDISTR